MLFDNHGQVMSCCVLLTLVALIQGYYTQSPRLSGKSVTMASPLPITEKKTLNIQKIELFLYKVLRFPILSALTPQAIILVLLQQDSLLSAGIHHLQFCPRMSLDTASERVCYVHCNFCNTILVVTVPCSTVTITNAVTVRCGLCANLLSLNTGALLQTSHLQNVHKQNLLCQDLSEGSQSSSKGNKLQWGRNHELLQYITDLSMGSSPSQPVWFNTQLHQHECMKYPGSLQGTWYTYIGIYIIAKKYG
ncbi:hypothetical protein SADUNF_Sadunf06G0157500 [Salix dunnii]|uniref:YABBY N-terminal domain-containing protein n=1 Tax=Salix dunnii TaxID=1413687 RepID=A0A835K214_9ROSI|nr:hypothetical protein SADUNF_Sadunf06G0157500 [Salix dunnii]